jgi:hypothetical protein
MLWSRVSASSLAIYGDEGEWIATCATPEIAGAIVTLHNVTEVFPSPLRSVPNSQQLNESRKFSKDVEALIEVADKHLDWTTRL